MKTYLKNIRPEYFFFPKKSNLNISEPEFKVSFVRRHANRAAPVLARRSCFEENHTVGFTPADFLFDALNSMCNDLDH